MTEETRKKVEEALTVDVLFDVSEAISDAGSSAARRHLVEALSPLIEEIERERDQWRNEAYRRGAALGNRGSYPEGRKDDGF